MKILFTICGRAGSKGIKNKNSKNFLGVPLPFYTLSIINMFIKSNDIYECDVVLNTDSDELIELFKEKTSMPVEIIKRKPELGKDTTAKISVIQNSYSIIKNRLHKNYDLVVDLDITSPLRTIKDLEALVKKQIESNSDVVFSVTDSRRNPYFNMVMKTENGYKRVINSTFNTRQEAPVLYDMNASMYAYSPEFLMTGKGIFDGKCEVIKMMDTAVLDIDHQKDFEFMEVIAEYLFRKDTDMRLMKENIEFILVT